MDKQSYVPEGYNAVMPALAIHKDANVAIEWYKDVFNAVEKMVLKEPSGKVGHAELIIGDSIIMVSDEYPQYNKSPKTLNGNSINLNLYVPDVDAILKKAVDKGARVIMPAEDQFYGDRTGRIEDPFGYIWIISTHVRDVPEEEMKKLVDEMMAGSDSSVSS